MAKQYDGDVDEQPTPPRKRTAPPARSPEARENQLIALAMDEAEKRIRSGTATSQLLTEFIRLGTTKARIEKENKEIEAELNRAKIKQIESQKNMEEMYGKALDAMRLYRGPQDDED